MDGIHSGEAKDSDTYTGGGSREDNIGAEDGSGRERFQYPRSGKVGSSNTEGSGGEDGSGHGIICT